MGYRREKLVEMGEFNLFLVNLIISETLIVWFKYIF